MRAAGANKVAKTFDLAMNLDQVLLPTLMVGIVTIILILTLEKTRLGALGMVAAIIVASLMVPLAGWDTVAQVNDIADVPGSLPRPAPAAAGRDPGAGPARPVAGLCGPGAGRGCQQELCQPPTAPTLTSPATLWARARANVFSGLFQGMPVGGSVSATSITVNAGARSRFANIFAGITMAVVIVIFGSAVGYIALPAIAGLLIVIGFRTLKPDQVEMVWKTGPIQQAVMVITFIFSLIVPLQHAVLIGVALSVVLFVVQQSNQITVKQWAVQPGKLPLEQDPPEAVPSNQVTTLAIYGSVFFATASLVEERLPEVTDDTRHAVVILAFQGGEGPGSTFLEVLERYALSLREHQSRLILAGVSENVADQLDETEIARTIGRDNIFPHTERIGESLNNAWGRRRKVAGRATASG